MLGFIGFGNMAGAIAKGILKSNLLKPEEIIVSRRDTVKLKETHDELGICVTEDNREVARRSNVIILSVKPQMLSSVIKQIKEDVTEDKLIVSIAAGKSTAWLCLEFEKDLKIIRCMPNTPALVGEGCTGICANELVTKEDMEYILTLFNSLGLAIEVPENLMDVVVGVSGSSPAYVFLFMEALADAAVMKGMPRKQAYQFVAQSVLGSAKLLLDTGMHPGELKDMVCSPGGTTIEAVKVLEDMGLRSAVINAAVSCIEKSKNL